MKTIKTITQLGSNWNNGTNAGGVYWNLNNSVGNRNRNISSHLVNCKFQPGQPTPADSINCGNHFNLATWQKRKISGARQADEGQ